MMVSSFIVVEVVRIYLLGELGFVMVLWPARLLWFNLQRNPYRLLVNGINLITVGNKETNLTFYGRQGRNLNEGRV